MDAADKTAKLLAALWERNLPIVQERFAVLDSVAAAAVAGSLDEATRTDGVNNAHKLAGALGMYGYDEGTRIARELEVLLCAVAPDGSHLQRLCAELRASVFPQA